MLCGKCLSYFLENEKENKIGLMKNLRSNAECSRGHDIYQFLAGILRNFQQFTCSPYQEISLLSHAIKIRSKKTALTIKARLCKFEQWEVIT